MSSGAFEPAKLPRGPDVILHRGGGALAVVLHQVLVDRHVPGVCLPTLRNVLCADRASRDARTDGRCSASASKALPSEPAGIPSCDCGEQKARSCDRFESTPNRIRTGDLLRERSRRASVDVGL